jgi:hypothetical protein
MIPIQKECECLHQMFRIYEKCFFCGNSTDTWHIKTNQPVCKECAKCHKVAELPKSHPDYDHRKIKDDHKECKQQTLKEDIANNKQER